MEAILENLSMDATAGKLKAITDACDEGLGTLQVFAEIWIEIFANFVFLLCFQRLYPGSEVAEEWSRTNWGKNRWKEDSSCMKL